MNILELFGFIADNLIPIMLLFMMGALLLRYAAYKAGQRDSHYFKSFARSIEKTIEQDGQDEEVDDIDSWLDRLMRRVTGLLPDRSVRFGAITSRDDDGMGGSFRAHQSKKMRFDEFSDGTLSVVHAVKRQGDAFHSIHPPNFSEVTERVLSEDKQWTTMFGVVPVETLSRILDIMPGLFIVGGIFGTFIGITNALPMIATINLDKIAEATPILNNFVASIAFSMNTSIAGIVCSVVLTILNTVFPLSRVRNNVRKDLERCFEFMWYRIHGDKLSFGERKMLAALQAIHGELVDQNSLAGNGKDQIRKAS